MQRGKKVKKQKYSGTVGQFQKCNIVVNGTLGEKQENRTK